MNMMNHKVYMYARMKNDREGYYGKKNYTRKKAADRTVL